ncbi:DUF1002 domain-containing protein [Aerococcaceae bacterium DSM 111022]|nr:DUF1002 domain-containing protein [Aerococcaceae bacterium DSM 111022]
MNKKIITTGLIASLLAVGGASQVLDATLSIQAVQTQQQQGMQLVSLGASLTQQQAQQTLQLLGAGHVPQNAITYIDGNMVNRYLNDGSNANTTVLSSAYISEMPAGYGVRVNVVTPQNITLVSSTTYQNAAITAGISNAQLNIATVSPVTGEGALVGIYALLEDQGALNPADAQVAQREIQVINNITETTEINNTQINQVVAIIKTNIVNNNVQNVDIDINQIVNQIALEYNITDQTIIDQLIIIAEEFNSTEAATEEGTAEQIENSIVLTWPEALGELSAPKTKEEILDGERLDYSDQETYNPIFQKFADAFYSAVETDQSIDELYSHTFVFERITPTLTGDEKNALNALRSAMYEYKANGDMSEGQTKSYWTTLIQEFETLKTTDPELAEIYNQIALVTGYAPEAYAFTNLAQDGTQVSVTIQDNSIPEQPVLGTYVYDVATGEIFAQDTAADSLVPLAGVFDFNARYGATVENQYQGTPISSEYTIPGYEPEESSEETSSEDEESESDETSVEEEISSEESFEEPPVESTPPEQPIESVPEVPEESEVPAPEEPEATTPEEGATDPAE